MKKQKKIFIGCFIVIAVLAIVITLAFSLSSGKNQITISLYNPIKNETTLIKQKNSAVLKKARHPNISGYEFIGWFFDNEFKNRADENQIFSSNIGLIAGYSKILTKDSSNFEVPNNKLLTISTSNGQKITQHEIKKLASFVSYLDLSNAEIENNEIGSDTFSFSNISTLILPKTLKTIDERAFFNATELENIEFNNELVSINERAFANCSNLENVVLPESLVRLGDDVFQNCNIELKIGSNLKNFNAKSLQYAKISNLELSLQNPNFIETDGCIFTRDMKHLVYAVNDNDIEINAAIIDDYALFESDAKSVTIKGAQRIGKYAFSGMKNLEAVKIENSTSYEIDEFAFYDCPKLKTIELGCGLGEVKNSAFENCLSLKQVTFINSLNEDVKKLTTIGEKAFDGCKNLQEINLPESVTQLGKNAFANCDKLKKVTLSPQIIEIKEETFKNCYDLENILLAENVSAIDNYAFLNCISLQNISCFENISVLGVGAFKDCEKLQSVELNKVKIISPEAFMNCKNLVSANFELAESFLQNAFFGCKNMRTFTFYENVSSIDFSAFDNAGLESVSSFSNAFYSENGVLYNNEKTAILLYPLLKKDRIFTIKANILQIFSQTFFENTSIEKFVVEEENTAFACDDNGVLLSYNKEKIIRYPNIIDSTYYVNDNVKILGKKAFANNEHLKTLKIPAGVEEIEVSCFENTLLFSLEIPFVGKSRDKEKFIGYAFGASEYIANENFVPSSLENVVVTDDSYIAPYSFFGAKNLTQIEITAKNYVVNEYAFFSTESLSILKINGAIPEMKEFSLANIKQENLQITFHFNDELELDDNCISGLPSSTKVLVKGQIKYEQIMTLKSKFQQIYAPSYYWPWEFSRY